MEATCISLFVKNEFSHILILRSFQVRMQGFFNLPGWTVPYAT